MIIGIVVIFASLTILSSCKFGHPDYTLTVTIGEGITGTPEAGSYVYKEFSEIEYSYTPEEGKVQPELLVG